MVHKNDLMSEEEVHDRYFRFNAGEDGVSVNWDKYSTPEDSLVIVGMTHKFGKQELKNPDEFRVCAISIEQVRSASPKRKLLHEPTWRGDPPLIGKPNNRAHTVIVPLETERERVVVADCARMVPESQIDRRAVQARLI